jgi:hypothetical protein
VRLVLTALLLIGNAWAASDAEKIQYLIGSVEHMQNAKFIRNGRAYDAKAAAEHLREKKRNAKGHCDTAEDFIKLCGAKSSESGKPYQIRFADGKVVTSEQFLRQKLREFEKR